MKNIFIASLTLLSFSTCGLAAPETSKLEAQVQKVNSDFFQATSTNNVERFDQIVADDAIFSTKDNEGIATRENARDYLVSQKRISRTDTIIKYVNITTTKISGNSAVVIGRLLAVDKRKKIDFNGHRAFVNVFVATKENDWKLVTCSMYEIKKN